MINPSWPFLILLFLVFSCPAHSQPGEMESGPIKRARTDADYSAKPLADVLREPPSGAGPAPFRIQAVPVGKIRPLSPDRQKALARWANSFASNPDQFIRSYTLEGEINDGPTHTVLCLRKKEVLAWEAGAAAGQAVVFLVIRVGGGADLMPAMPGANQKGTNQGGEIPTLLLVEALRAIEAEKSQR